MKKFYKLILFIIGILSLSSCNNPNERINVIIPSGTPSLGVTNFLASNQELVNYKIVDGTDLLAVAFTNGDYDVILAPINLGAKMYQRNQQYILNSVLVWGNLFIASKEPLEDFKSLENKEITIFGKYATPDIVMTKLLTYYNLKKVKVNYVNDVTTAQGLFLTNKADIILTAEPSLSMLKTKVSLYELNLQHEWYKITSDSSYPQVGVFIKKEKIEDKRINHVISAFIKSIDDTIAYPSLVAEKAVTLHESFERLGVDVLTNAISNCSYYYQNASDSRKAIELYFEQIIAMGLTEQIGGGLPNEEFYQK